MFHGIMFLHVVRLLTTQTVTDPDFLPLLHKLPLENVLKYKYKHAKIRWSIGDKVHVHHIIPRQFRNHPVLIGYDIENGYNLMFMPNKLGKAFLRTTRPCHEGGHSAYNRYVGKCLEHIYRDLDYEDHIIHVRLLSAHLRHRSANDRSLPWL